MPAPPRSPATATLLTEAVRLLEADGPLEDSQALREAAAAGGALPAQAGRRAATLAQRLGLPARLAQARQLAPWVLLGLAAVVLLLGLAAAGAVVDAPGRRINVMAALAGLLGLHLVSFALWLLALAWPAVGASGGSLMGRLLLQLTARLALGRGAEGAALLHGGLQVLARARALPWLLGLAAHVVWTLAFLATLGALLFALSFRQYTLGWETTLLDPAVFRRAVHALAVAPGWLGFAAPHADMPSDRELALWLVGCVVVYGLVPRALAALLCAGVWVVRARRLAPDWSLPYYQALFTRLQALAPRDVVDADTHHPHGPQGARAGGTAAGGQAMLLGFELPPELPWPPAAASAGPFDVRRIEGSAAERQALLQELQRLRPRLLVVACHAAASPDRGTERLLREALPLVGECRLWPLHAGAIPSDLARWQQWLGATGLGGAVACTADAAAALRPPAPTQATP